MQPIVVKDASNPFFEPQNISPLRPTYSVRPTTEPAIGAALTERNNDSKDVLPTREPSADLQQLHQVTDAPSEKVTAPVGITPSARRSESSDRSRNRNPPKADNPSRSTPHDEKSGTESSASLNLRASGPSNLGAEGSSLRKSSISEEPEVQVEKQIQQRGETVIGQEPERLAETSSANQKTDPPSSGSDDAPQKAISNDDYSIPIKDDIAPAVPTSPRTALGTSAKNSFSPSAVTFAALPTRDLPRGRSIGPSKHQRMTSHLVESTVPEALPALKTPGPPPSTAFPRPSENNAAASKALRDSKTGAAGAGSSWISRKVLAGSGGEDLRKSVAASKRPSIFDRAMEEESDQEADELEDRKHGAPRASEAPLTAQRFSIASKTPQPQHARQTLGPSTLARPEQPPTNLSKMIADLQERRAVATFNASVTRATIPSLQLGRGAQGIAGMGISSGLLGRAALQASLERSRGAESPATATAADVFDEKSSVATKPLATDAQLLQPGANAQSGPSTTEELNEAVDEILRKISTERQMQDQESSATPQRPTDEDTVPELVPSISARQEVDGATRSTIPSTARTSSTRAEEQEVEELTKRTNALSVGTRASDRIDILRRPAAKSPAIVADSPAHLSGNFVKEDVQPRPAQSTTPTNSPPRAVIYRSSGDKQSIREAEVAPPVQPAARTDAKLIREVVTAPRERPEATEETPRTTHPRPLPLKTVGQHGVPPKGLSQSQALSVSSEESESSDSEEEKGDKRFDEAEVLADEVAKLAKPLHLSSTPKAPVEQAEDCDSDSSVEEVESNGSRAPVSPISSEIEIC